MIGCSVNVQPVVARKNGIEHVLVETGSALLKLAALGYSDISPQSFPV